MSITTKNIKYGSGTVGFRAVFNKKPSNTVVCVKYTTKEERLLYVILEKFIAEKVLDYGININNHISSAFATTKGICMIVPDNKIFSVIQQLHRYVLNTTLNLQQQRHAKHGSYTRLYKDISSFNVDMVGKCRITERALGNAGDKKIDNFIRGMDAITYKNKDDFDITERSYKCVDIDCGKLNNSAKMAFSICYSNIPYVFHGDHIEVLNHFADLELKKQAIFKNCFQARVKSFQSQFGSVGVPASNDTNQTKFKEKSKLILTSCNMIADIYSYMHNFEYKYSNVDAIKSVDSEALKAAKAVSV